MRHLATGFLVITGFCCFSILITFHYSHHELRVLQDLPIQNSFGSSAFGSGQFLPFNSSTKIQKHRGPRLSSNTTTIYYNDALTVDPPLQTVHLIYTRFMQNQGNLTSLGQARLKLLKEFFLNSLQGQTIPSHEFLVVIRTDPELIEELKGPLIELLKESKLSQYIILATNHNPRHSQYRDLVSALLRPQQQQQGEEEEEEATEIAASVLSGNVSRALEYLQHGYSNEATKIPTKTYGSSTPFLRILETRLDADDGLARTYLQTLQNDSQATALSLPTLTSAISGTTTTTTSGITNEGHWKVWCAGRYLEWQYAAPKEWAVQNNEVSTNGDNEATSTTTTTNENKNKTVAGLGSLVSLQLQGCLSAGLTIAYTTTFESTQDSALENRLISLNNHMELDRRVSRCSYKKKGTPKHKKGDRAAPTANCVAFLKLNPSALRARTPTSAGMLNILWDDGGGDANADGILLAKEQKNNDLYQLYQRGAAKQREYQRSLWVVAAQLFGVTPQAIRDIRAYFSENMGEIARENLQGQCSHGHSCKNSSQAFLQAIVAHEQQERHQAKNEVE